MNTHREEVEVNIYMLFTGWEVRTGKISSRGLRSGSQKRGRRPRDASETEGRYFSVRTDLNGK